MTLRYAPRFLHMRDDDDDLSSYTAMLREFSAAAFPPAGDPAPEHLFATEFGPKPLTKKFRARMAEENMENPFGQEKNRENITPREAEVGRSASSAETHASLLGKPEEAAGFSLDNGQSPSHRRRSERLAQKKRPEDCAAREKVKSGSQKMGARSLPATGLHTPLLELSDGAGTALTQPLTSNDDQQAKNKRRATEAPEDLPSQSPSKLRPRRQASQSLSSTSATHQASKKSPSQAGCVGGPVTEETKLHTSAGDRAAISGSGGNWQTSKGPGLYPEFDQLLNRICSPGSSSRIAPSTSRVTTRTFHSPYTGHPQNLTILEQMMVDWCSYPVAGSAQQEFCEGAQDHPSNQSTPSTHTAHAQGAGCSSLSEDTRLPSQASLNVARSSKSSKTQSCGFLDFSGDLWLGVGRFLSSLDIGNLRLTCQRLSQVLAPIQYRNIVVDFGTDLFSSSPGVEWDTRTGSLPANSMLERYGPNINRFGISFEYDLHGLCTAKPKVIEKEQSAWFGEFTWPTEHYPRFSALQKLEDLVDHNKPLLKEAFKHVTQASQLGLCIDSGHGWLEGPDMSDLALFNRRANGGCRVFGKTFKTEDALTARMRDEYFKWAQENTLDETTKYMTEKRERCVMAGRELQYLKDLKIRDMQSFEAQSQQFDRDHHTHVGHHDTVIVHTDLQLSRDRRRPRPRGRQMQWPLIFNGYNLAAAVGGHCTYIQDKTANPQSAPLLPGGLTEAQAQWLLETVWAQRSFLSAYTTAIISNKRQFEAIHTLRVSKLSSGLLPSLAQAEFWKSLPGLERLEILVSPDWRQEHVVGDRLHSTNMPIPPTKAAQKFSDFLRRYVANIESLLSLSIGYVGGGEHAVGMFARNQHVLPAPIADNTHEWLHRGKDRPMDRLTKFDHIRHLEFHNCWFSPWMLKDFMKASRDTSLHSLTLDSVSMLLCSFPIVNDPPLGHPPSDHMETHLNAHSRPHWMWEVLPDNATWCHVLECITPGATMRERKYEAGFREIKADGEVLTEPEDKPKRKFRGHIQSITLKSCGYVKITAPEDRYGLLQRMFGFIQPPRTSDEALEKRRARFYRSWNPASDALVLWTSGGTHREPDHHDNSLVMMSTLSPSGTPWPWLGTLTQQVSVTEKRVLEDAWGMTFGWADNLDRWAAVEDGFLEGGTGRFSGVIRKGGDADRAYDKPA